MIWSTRIGHPALEGSASADVAVVGGGLLGAALTLELARRGVAVALLEAGAIGSGTTERSLGMLQQGVHFHYSVALKALGAHRVPDLWKLTRENLAIADQAVRDEGIECGYARCRVRRVAGSDRERETLRESDAAMPPGFEAVVDPPALARGLALAAARRGARVFEGTRIESVNDEPRALRLTSVRGTMRTDMAVHAHNGALPELVAYMSRSGVVTEPLAPCFPEPISANYGRDVMRQLPDGRIAAVTGRFHEGAVAPDASAEAMERVRAFAPRAQLQAQWSTLHGFSCDELPDFGPLPGTVRQYVACGAHGSEMSYALVGARMIADLLTKGTSDLPYKWFDPRRHQL